MTDFVFKKEKRKICYEISKSVANSGPLCNIAEKIATGESSGVKVTDSEIKSLETVIEKGLVKYENGKVSFTDEIFLVFFLALGHIDDFKGSFENHAEFLEKLEKADHSYSYRISSKYTEMILLILDNLFNLNVIDKLIKMLDTLNEEEVRRFFNTVAPILAYLRTDNDKLLNLLKKIEKKYSEKFLDNFNLRATFRIFGAEEPKRAKEFLDTIVNQFYLGEFVINILHGLSESQEFDFKKAYKIAYEIVNKTDHVNFMAGILALTKFDYSQHQELRDKTYNYFVELTKSNDEKTLSAIVRGFNYFLKQEERGKDWLIHFSKSEIKEIQEQVAWCLTWNNQMRNEAWYKEVLLNLTSLREQNQNITLSLYSYVKTDPELVFRFLDKWLNESIYYDGKISKIFDNLFPEIYNNQNKMLEKYFTKWLNHDNPLIQLYISKVFDDLIVHGASLKLDKEELDALSDKDVKFVFFKVLGFVSLIGGEKLLCDLIFSILKREPESKIITELVQEAFISYINYNLPGYTSTFLEEKQKSGNKLEKKVVKNILAEDNKYYDKLHKIPELKELAPSPERLKAYDKVQNKSFREAYKKTESKSSILSMFPQYTVKGGKGYFFKQNGEYREKSNFQQIKSRYEVARGLSIDPVRMEDLKHCWRAYEREKDEISNS